MFLYEGLQGRADVTLIWTFHTTKSMTAEDFKSVDSGLRTPEVVESCPD